MSQNRKSTSGRGDASLVERAEALLDEAVGQAAKGSYREAAEKAQQALAIDPDNTAARDLLESYRRQVTDDDERRRRRRSIAAAAAAIEEMVENERLDEASSATDALSMQFGHDAPIEDLRRRIAEARAENLDFDDLDAAIDSIRVSEPRPSQAGRAEPGGAIAAEVEAHLRAGRLDEASRAVSRLEREPEATDRALKLRTRVEEAMHVAAEHRREEEILIATAAIEERIRRGSIDDAAERIADLERRHGESAPVAELGQRLAEARALQSPKAAVGAAAEDAAVPSTASAATPPVFGQSLVDEEQRSGRSRWIAIAAAVVVALGAGAWWLTRGGGETNAPIASKPAASSASAPGDVVAPGSPDTQPSAVDSAGTTATDGSDAPSAPAAPVAPSTAQRDAAPPPASSAEARRNEPAAPARATSRTETDPAPPPSRQAAAAPPPAAVQAPPNVSEQAPPPVADTRNANAPADPDAAPAPPPATPATAEVVVEAVPAAEVPPPPPPAPAAEQVASAPAAADPPAQSAASPPPQREAAPEPTAETRQAAVAAPPPAAAPPPSTGPAILGCGDPGVVCLKSLQVPTPRYPAAARARRLSGNVVVMALVNEQGRVIQARVDSGSFAFFNEAALDAARRATFQPATRQGVPGQSWARLTFRFEEP